MRAPCTLLAPLGVATLLALVADASDFCESRTSCVQTGFCTDVANIETLGNQPEDQLERWDLPFVNSTHLVIRWAPSPALCGQVVESYVVSLNSSSRVFNLVLSVFGSFPQDTCAEDSPARAAASVGNGSRPVNPCGPYERRCAHHVTETIVELHQYQWRAFAWAPNNLTVQASAYARLRGSAFSTARNVPLWCISFRKYSPCQGRAGGARDARKPLSSLRRAVSRAGSAVRQLSGAAVRATAALANVLLFNVNPAIDRERSTAATARGRTIVSP
mmetsp:Transcript_7303/g.21416  ORF Transcript_7303/g.21416 Transcript_7303/m.21416 type:complete len:275 (+) Transcript_7303:32-856(+)